jgi:hypothetical protein
MEVKDLFCEKGKFNVNNGDQTRFWKDHWLGTEPLRLKYPGLYRNVRRKNVTISGVLNVECLV